MRSSPLLVLAGPHPNYSHTALGNGIFSWHNTMVSVWYKLVYRCAMCHYTLLSCHMACCKVKVIMEYYRKIKFRLNEENSILKSQNHFLQSHGMNQRTHRCNNSWAYLEKSCLIWCQCQARISEVKMQLERREWDMRVWHAVKYMGFPSISCPGVVLGKMFVDISTAFLFIFHFV